MSSGQVQPNVRQLALGYLALDPLADVARIHTVLLLDLEQIPERVGHLEQ